MNETKKPTGYPSVDKPWLKYYDENAETKANSIPLGKTVWDVIEERLYKYIDVPAIEYFGRTISRKEFISEVYLWARALKAIGVEENEVIPYYGPFMPDICAIVFALNMIGACPYFLKLAISPDALAEETKDSRFAIVFDQMWDKVSGEFSKDKYEKVIVARITDAMPTPKKQIVSLLTGLKNRAHFPKGQKYITVQEARKLAPGYSGELKVPFIANRGAFITSSSGTTVGGVVKATVATNESTISQLYMGDNSKINYFPGDRCLNHFPPTASTSLNVLFLLALFMGETVLIDPRVSEKDFYNQITKLKPNIALTTGSAWEAFFARVEEETKNGKRFDFSCAKGWIVGGEGTDPKKFKKWDKIMEEANAYNLLFSGYGSSELFSATSCETLDARCDFSKPAMSVGIPYAGITMGVFGADGKELPYNTRGELWIKSKSAMKEYYNKPNLSSQVKVDGWIRTGDLAEIDENGMIYIWGRCKDTVTLKSGKEIYLFDISNKIKEKDYIDDAIVLPMPTADDKIKLVAHIVWTGDLDQSKREQNLADLNLTLQEYLPEDMEICGYAEHEIMLPYSPTTLKKDKNKLSGQLDGYVQVVDGKISEIRFSPTEEGSYRIIYQ